MARPQIEDGYTPIANELLDQLCFIHLSSNQWQILLCIIRKTYGYRKKVDYIANSQIIQQTGLGKSVVSRALAVLQDLNMIFRQGKNIGVQKDWEQWKKLAESSTKVSNTDNKSCQYSQLLPDEKLAISQPKLAILQPELAESSTKVSSPRITQKKKETITKETLQKKVYGEFENILLSDKELQKLKDRFGEKEALDRIEAASESFKSHRDYSKKFGDHYATILSWARMDEKRNGGSGNGRIPAKVAAGNAAISQQTRGQAGSTGIRIIDGQSES